MASPAEDHLDPIGEDDEDVLELNEEDLFDEEPSARSMRHTSSSSALVIVSDDEEDIPSPSAAAMDLGSGKSSTLALEDSSNMLSPMQGVSSGNAIQSRAAPGWSMPQRQFPTARAITQSLPAHQSHIRMGSSVPIGIPLTGVRGFKDPHTPAHGGPATHANGRPTAGSANGSTPPEDSPSASGPFIPPHQMSLRDESFFSFTGDSPAAGLKRDKLRQRTAILISTGFLETGAMAIRGSGKADASRGGMGGGMSQLPFGNGGYDASSVPVSSSFMSMSRGRTGGLSQALQKP